MRGAEYLGSPGSIAMTKKLTSLLRFCGCSCIVCTVKTRLSLRGLICQNRFCGWGLFERKLIRRGDKHHLYYFLHSQIAFSQRFDSYKAHPECGEGEEPSKPIKNTERISDILFKKFVEKKNTLKHIELNVIL